MSAEGYGKRLLDEVKEVGLDELLRTLRNLHTPRKLDHIGLPALDQILNVFLQPPPRERPQWESPAQTPAVTAKKKVDPPPVVEIAGATPCSGKTQLLYHFAMLSLLPESHGGKGGAVVWLDTDNRFSIHRLQTMLSSHLAHSFNEPPAQATLNALLQNIHIFQPQSTPSLLATLAQLPTYLLNPTLHSSGPLRLQTLIISNLSAFFHQDHLDSDLDNLQSNSNSNQNTNTNTNSNALFLTRWRALVSSFRSIQRTFECTIMAGNWAFSLMQRPQGKMYLRPHLPSPWTQFCTLRLVVQRDGVNKFAPGMSVEEAMRDRKLREEAVEKSAFTCGVNFWGDVEWRGEGLEGVKRVENGGAFGFRIEEIGVRILEREDEKA
ncbi:MAG: hypothetical protein MMC33_008147 [Icmadophila ericetorum]|nr:hypothetical protein [Icmadophila ericetorum]